MAAYFARRFLLLIPTFLGITMLVFAITRFVPGGPVDQAIVQMQMGGAGGETGGGGGESSVNLDPKAIEALERHYHFDWPLWKQYLQFLGPINFDERGLFGDDVQQGELVDWEADPGETIAAGEPVVRIRMFGLPREDDPNFTPSSVSERLTMPEEGKIVEFVAEKGSQVPIGATLFRYEPAGSSGTVDFTMPDAWSKNTSGLLTLDLGNSYKFESPVIEMIVQRFPISLRFGLTGFLLAYLICVPLGVLKAVRHSSKFDIGTSVLIFVGYSIPGWALGAVLLVLYGGGSFWDWFPLGGIHSDNYETLSSMEKLKDSAYHMVLPVIAYAIGSFAVLTVLMKNSLMENLGQDYVRTAFAKGLSERRVIMVHALRNSLIPICTGLGHALGILMAGSYLIEKVFNIDGIGLLGFESIVGRDYTVVMGVLVINTLLMLIGNIISDVLYVLVDPRIRFS